MALFKFHFENKMNIILITTLVWGINFRSTFKNNSESMGLGSCWVLRFDPLLPLIKNIICIFYLVVFFYQVKLSKAQEINTQILVKKQEGSKIKIELTDLKQEGETIINAVEKANNLDNLHLKILFWVKISILILITFF